VLASEPHTVASGPFQLSLTFCVKSERSVCDWRDNLCDVSDCIYRYWAFHFGNWPVISLTNKPVALFTQ